jgi:hypothetical protein
LKNKYGASTAKIATGNAQDQLRHGAMNGCAAKAPTMA